MEHVVSDFLKRIKLPISRRHCEKLILAHPDYPALISIVDVLDRYGVSYEVSRITKDEVPILRFPCLFHLDMNGGDMVVINSETDLLRKSKKLDYWSGVVLQADAKDHVSDNESKEWFLKDKVRKYALGLLLGILLSLLFQPFAVNYSWSSLVLLVTSLGGVTIGYFLIAKDVGVEYTLVESFCNASKQVNCDSVLNSSGARLLGFAKLSDLVITYFISQLAWLAFYFHFPERAGAVPSLFFFSSLLTVPIIIFSISYQYFITKVWCRLCLLVNLVLVIQLAYTCYVYLFDLGLLTVERFSIGALAAAFVAFAMVGAAVISLKSIVEGKKQLEQEVVLANRVKHSIPVFTQLLMNQERVDTTPFSHELSVGKAAAPIELLVVSNLYCSPCKEQHEKVSDLIAAYPDTIKVSMRFILSGKDYERHVTSSSYVLEYWLQHIRGHADESKHAIKMLHDWYEEMNFENFRQKYFIDEPKGEFMGKLLEAEHFHWADYVQISNTPTLHINGYKLPSNYNISDLMAMIPGLAPVLQKSEQLEDTILH